MEVENNNMISFQDIYQVEKRVYRKPTHTDRYLNRERKPKQKRGVTETVTERAKRICEPHYLKQEMTHLDTALQNNDYLNNKI